jgi:glucose-6-phosphate isomerase
MGVEVNTDALNIEDLSEISAKLEEMRQKELPVFENHHENVIELASKLKEHMDKKKLILIGNGGSNTSFLSYYKALLPLKKQQDIAIVTSQEPDYINDLKSAFPKDETIVMPISKSGNTLAVLEVLFDLLDYKVVPVTTNGKGALFELCQAKGLDFFEHPPVGGRYSGLTACAFIPALFYDIDCESIDKGAREMYSRCGPSVPIDQNPALSLAARMFLLEKKGYQEIFCPLYSKRLSGFSNLIVQLLHESVCKNGEGQTIYCAEAPESQHHTNQRFFGGKKNVIGLFIRVRDQNDQNNRIKVPDGLKGLELKSGKLGDVDNVPYAKALEFEFFGTFQDAQNNNIPGAEIVLEKLDAYNIGQLIGLWHYIAVYSSWLRDVNPFDQPQVEASKDISFRLTQVYKD